MKKLFLGLLTITLLPLSSAFAGSHSRQSEKRSHPPQAGSGCVSDAHGNCNARISTPDADPCASGNCGLEYKSRSGGGSHSRSVLKMSMGGRHGGKHRWGGGGRRGGSRRGGGRSFRHH